MTGSEAGQVAVTLVALAVAGWRGWRSRRATGDAPRLFVRLLLPPCLLGLAVALGVWFDDGAAEGRFAVTMGLVALLLFCILGGLGTLVVELLAWRLRPVRTIRWLASAAGLFLALFMLVPALLFAWLRPDLGAGLLDWSLLEWAGMVIATAILWWSYLPAARPLLSRVFE